MHVKAKSSVTLSTNVLRYLGRAAPRKLLGCRIAANRASPTSQIWKSALPSGSHLSEHSRRSSPLFLNLRTIANCVQWRCNCLESCLPSGMARVLSFDRECPRSLLTPAMTALDRRLDKSRYSGRSQPKCERAWRLDLCCLLSKAPLALRRRTAIHESCEGSAGESNSRSNRQNSGVSLCP